MKKLFLLSLTLFFVGCTQADLKDEALKAADAEYNQVLAKEIVDMPMPGRLRDNYLSFLRATSKMEVVDIKKSDDDHATVSVRQEAVPLENRKTLASIASTLEPQKAGNFNMGNAINLIEQQPGQIKGKRETLYFYKFHKSAGKWVRTL